VGERPFVPDFEKEQEVVRLQQLLEDIKNGSFARVYLLYGEETYLRLQYRDKLKKALIPDGDTMNYHYFEGKGVETAQLIDLAETLPFFAERRVIVVENSGLFKKSTEDLAEYFKAPAPSVCFVFVETEVDKRGRLYKAVRDTGRVVEFARQNEATLQKWILIQLKKEGKRITQNDLQFFQQRVGSDMENISRELEKLFCYTMGRDVITAADIEAVCTRQIGNQIFDMVEAIAMRRQKQALDLYYDLLTLKEPPMRILFLIARQFNLLMQVRQLKRKGLDEKQIAEKTGLRSFVVRKYVSQSARFTWEELKEALTACVETEEAVKTGQMNDRMSVELLIIAYSGEREKSMSSLIFFIFMIWFIMRIVKNKQKAAGQNDPKHTQGSNTPGSAATRTGSTYSTAAGSAKKSAYESAMAFQKTATGSGAGSSSSRLGNSTVGSDGSSSSSASTTAYLERKAKEDARDHAQEKREEQARLHQETGGRMVGVRYYEWDSIPKGNRVVKCNYCGAENLISERYKPNRYTCYFCREILE